MIPVETVPGIRGGVDEREQHGVNSSMIYLIHCENFCKYSNVPPSRPTIIITIKNRKKRTCICTYMCVFICGVV
jgi:hypothetical protein